MITCVIIWTEVIEMVKKITECPSCKNKLQIVTLKCNKCGLELHNEFESTPFEALKDEQYDFLIAFLNIYTYICKLFG